MQRFELERMLLGKIRQLSKDGQSLSEIQEQLRNSLPPRWQARSEELSTLYIQGGTNLSHPPSTQLLSVLQLAKTANTGEHSTHQVLDNWLDDATHAEIIPQATINQLRGSAAYIAFLLVILLLCSQIIRIKVLPSFAEMYSMSELGAKQLPQITQLFLGHSPVFNIILVALLILLSIQPVLIIGISAHMEHARSLPRWMRPLSFMMPLIRDLSALTYLRYRTLLQGVTDAKSEHTIASTMSGFTISADPSDLELAVELAAETQPAEERQYYSNRIAETFASSAAGYTQRMQILIIISGALLIGAFLMAMYLPIFKLGETI